MVKSYENGKIYLHLSDFGLAKNIIPDYVRLSTRRNQKGDPRYLPPELFLKDQ